VGHFRHRYPNLAKPPDKANDEGAKKAGSANAVESDWDSDSDGVWATEEIDGDRVMSSGANPGLGLSDLSTFGMFSDVAGPPLAKGDGLFEVAGAMDQLGDDEWDSEDDLAADFVW